MAETVDELTVTYEEDGIETVKELDKEVLTKGAWSTIIFRYQDWNRSKEEKVAGYRVYRRLGSDQAAELLAEVPATNTLYVDTTAPADVRAYYKVTAIDGNTPPVESAPSKEVTSR